MILPAGTPYEKWEPRDLSEEEFPPLRYEDLSEEDKIESPFMALLLKMEKEKPRRGINTKFVLIEPTKEALP